ncbi:MAG: MSMEG_0568 family radical SAM protein [Candidatus Bathyarchaeales archaeon]
MKSKFNPVRIKIELLCHGARATQLSDKGRKTGAGPAGGRFFLLEDGTCVEIPLQGNFVEKSPFTLVKRGNDWVIRKNGRRFANVKIVPNPRFYEKHTSKGTLMRKLAILHGKDCLASTVYSKCVYWSGSKQCKFCGIGLEKPDRLEIKNPQELSEVAEEAFREGVAKHVTLTTGTPSSPDKGAALLAEATKAIKERAALLVHVQLEPPKDKAFLDKLYAAGVDTVGIHAECFDSKVRSNVCPMKRNLDVYFEAWEYCVKLFGDAQVSSFVIVGLGESDKSILKGAEKLAELGVVPFLLPLHPIVGSLFEFAQPPSPQRMLRLYESVGEILWKHSLNPLKNKAGCVKCGACSALNEVFLYGFK